MPKILRKQLKRAASRHRYRRKAQRGKQDGDGTGRGHIDPSLPSRKFIKLISNTKISRADANKIFQLLSGHVPLNAYLHRFKRKNSAQCPACGALKETPQHFLLECPAYAYGRRKLRPRKGELETKFAVILTSENKSIMLARYIHANGRFSEESQDRATEGTETHSKTR